MGWLKNILWPQFRETIFEWQNDDTGQYAAALSFYTAFSFFPLILVLLSGLGWFLSTTELAREKNIENYILEPVRKQVGDEAAKELKGILNTVNSQLENKAVVGSSTGFFMLLLGAIGIFAQMESAFARIWKEYLPQPKPGIWPLIQRLLLGRLKAFVVVLGLGMFMVLTFLSSLLLSGTATFLDNVEEIPWVHDTWEMMPLWVQDFPIGSWTLRTLQFSAGRGVESVAVLVSVPPLLSTANRLECLHSRQHRRQPPVGTWAHRLDVVFAPWRLHAIRSNRLIHCDHALVLLRLECDVLRRGMGRGVLAAARSSLQPRQGTKRNQFCGAPCRSARQVARPWDSLNSVDHAAGL
jgi:uncharacterized BrkB/YihY/UPF0761 family membrane protein